MNPRIFANRFTPRTVSFQVLTLFFFQAQRLFTQQKMATGWGVGSQDTSIRKAYIREVFNNGFVLYYMFFQFGVHRDLLANNQVFC